MYLSCLHFSFVVKVHSVNNLLLSIFNNFPNGPSDHVTSWKGCDGEAVTFTCKIKGFFFPAAVI